MLNGLLPELFYTHYTLVVAAMHVLLSTSISPSALDRAKKYLDKFCETFAALYGNLQHEIHRPLVIGNKSSLYM